MDIYATEIRDPKAIGLHDFVVRDGAFRFDLDGELLQAIDPLDNAAVDLSMSEY